MRKRNLFKRSIIFLLNVIVLTNFTSKSYASMNDLTFNNMNIEQGISQSTVEVIFQDSKGYIWLGTNDGLNRYNGYEYKIYNYEEGTNSISHNGITDICEDDEENLWVGTVQGINKINHKSNEIKNYTEENNKIKDDSTSEILVTKDNKIIVGTYEGLQIYNKDKDSFSNILNQKSGLISNTVYTLDEDGQGNIWVGTDLGVQKISKNFKILKTYRSDGKENSIGKSSIYNVYCDDKYGFVWAGSSDDGVFKINIKTNEITGYSNNPKDENSLPANQSGAILRDNNGNLWIGTSDGLAYYDDKKDNFKVYKNKIYDKNSLVYNNIKSLMQDKEGIIWVGTYSGVSIFDTKSVIKHYKAGPDDDYLLSENMVHGVYEDSDGYLWVGSKTKGISIIDREKQTSKSINTSNNDIIGTDTINDITGYKDLIFIATDSGVLKIDKKSNTMKNYTTEDKMVNDAVKDIMVDDKGYLWIGTISGLSILNIETDEMIDMSNHISDDKYIKHIYQDLEGNYYLGLLKDEGLCYINIKDKSIKYYKHDKNDKASISSDRIRYINGDSQDNIWIGTSYGLNKFNKETEKFERFTAENGISNNTIYGVLVDNNDDIWISTNKGISKINQESKKIETLSVTDGLQGNEFNGNATFKSDSGELFFGGINGLNAFYPQEINKVNKDTKVLFDTFYIDNEEYDNIDGKKLSENSNNIVIKFFSPIYSNNRNLMYEYKLDGSSGEVFTTKNNYVTYNELSPGKYTFEARVIDSSGNKSEANKVTFIIKPPLWRSVPAILTYLVILILFIFRSKYKVKVLDKMVNERTRELQEEIRKNTKLHNENIRLERSKNNYFINISHELRTPLNVINSTNQLIQGLLKGNSIIKEEKLSYYIDISQRNCSRLLKLINNILDNSKLQNDMYEIIISDVDIVYLVEETALTLVDFVKSKGIELIIDPEIEEKIIKCDAHEIERCIINLVSNAVKYTPEGGSITVGIEDLDDKVKINVRDTGCGIDEKFHESIFNRFNQVLDDEVIKGGSGLGLTITKQIIKLHGGEIYVESKVGEGSNFVIILPVNQQVNK
ncbi:ligand-binding sensor domain-containing protein [Terrisporobacter sp.]